MGGPVSRLLKEVQFGDQTAAKRIHERYANQLTLLAGQRLGQRFRSKIAPEDIVQSVFGTFFRRHSNGDFDCANWNDLWALLAKITVNKCLVKISRLTTAKRDVNRESASADSQPIANQCFDDQPSAHEIVVFNETLEQLLDRIPTLWGEIVFLRLQGMSNFEISEQLGCSERTVYRNINRVKQILEDEHASTEAYFTSD